MQYGMQPALSRRGFLGSALLAGGVGLMPRMAFASADAELLYPHLAGLAVQYVDSGKLAGMVTLVTRAGRLPRAGSGLE